MSEPTARGNRRSKRERLAGVLDRAGMLWLGLRLGRYCTGPRLMVLTYHRILEAGDGFTGDPGLVDATPEDFRRQMEVLAAEATVLNAEEAYAFLKGGKARGHHPRVMITFDDGYVDNFSNAFGVLKELGLTAVFFVPTAYVGTGRGFWWDRTFRLVRAGLDFKARLRAMGVEPGEPVDENDPLSKRRFYNVVRRLTDAQRGQLLDEGERELGIGPDEDERTVMNWDEVRRLAEAGMDVGSHGHTHAELAGLSAGELVEEFSESRRVLEERLGRTVTTLSYPFGERSSFDEEAKLAARETGYRMAFSYFGGANRPGKCDLMDLKRISAERPTSVELFRAKLLAPGVFCSSWKRWEKMVAGVEKEEARPRNGQSES